MPFFLPSSKFKCRATSRYSEKIPTFTLLKKNRIGIADTQNITATLKTNKLPYTYLMEKDNTPVLIKSFSI